MTKKEIYKAYNIAFENGKIASPIGFINPVLINGNAKLGKGVWTFSTLAGTVCYSANVNGKEMHVNGTCACDCIGCYAKTGFFRMNSTINSLAVKTVLAREHVDFLKRAILAQIEADKIETIRIHASGDFVSDEYAQMWLEIAREKASVKFWTYTKIAKYESLFSTLENANIVKSIIPNVGLNYGHIDYVKSTFEKLESAGKAVHICKCGIDKNQHCTNCKGCATNEYVLFVEHSTDYKPEKESNWEEFKRFVEAKSNC